MKQSIIFGIVTLLSVVPAMAGRQKVELVPPSISSSSAWGMAQTVDRGQRGQTFDVRADVNFVDGTLLVVAIELEDRDGSRDWYDVAVMEVRLGTAYMLLDSRKNISPAFPVSRILGVRVNRKNILFLSGSFEH